MSDRKRRRLEKELEALENRHSLWTEKLSQLSEAKAIENDAATIFKLEQQIAEAEAEIEILKPKIEVLEEQISTNYQPPSTTIFMTDGRSVLSSIDRSKFIKWIGFGGIGIVFVFVLTKILSQIPKLPPPPLPSSIDRTTKPVITLPDLKLTPYKNTKLKISINHPENWNVQENINGFESEIKFVSDISSNESNNCSTELIIVVDELQDLFTLEEYKKLAIRKIENINQGIKVIDESSRVNILGGFNAYKLSYRQQDEKCTFNVLETGTVRYGKSYYITYKAIIDEFPKSLSIANTMIKSFRISE